MKNINIDIDSPFKLLISFNKVLSQYEQLAKNGDSFMSSHAERVLAVADKNPILREGFSDPQLLEKYESEIAIILQDSFSPILTKNEIKAASIPFHDLIFNSSERFKKYS